MFDIGFKHDNLSYCYLKYRVNLLANSNKSHCGNAVAESPRN